jgi:uncharacterized protein
VAKKLIIAAHSARGFAQAAVACGYEVITLDAFADADTQAFSTQNFKLKFNDFVLDAADFKRVFSSVNLDEVEGFLYGSLFDNCPEVLAWVATQVRLLGNVPEVMQVAKSFEFFKLLDELGVQYPEVRLNEQNSLPSFPRKRESILTLKTISKKMDSRFRGNVGEKKDWLSKQIGGTGGTHIKPATQAKNGDYFQHKIDGKPISMLFVADGKTAQLIGFNEQFIAPTIESPYRFAGAVSNVILADNVQQQFSHAAQKLTSALGLRGICSLDAILAGETLWVLELNPRLSATFHLYSNLLPLHLQGCAGDLKAFQPPQPSANAQLILYADKALAISAYFAWPNWAADIPAVASGETSVKINQDAPICSVLAGADKAEAAHDLVLQRAKTLKEMMLE